MRTNVEYKITTLFLILKTQIKSKNSGNKLDYLNLRAVLVLLNDALSMTIHLTNHRTKNKIRTKIVTFKVAFLKKRKI